MGIMLTLTTLGSEFDSLESLSKSGQVAYRCNVSTGELQVK